MDSIRLERVQSAIKDQISVLINQNLKNPKVPFITVTSVTMTRDAKQATVWVSILNLDGTERDPAVMKECLEGLNQSKGFLKRGLAQAIQLRAMPELIFKEDKGLENTLRVNELLKQIESEKKAKPSSDNP